MHSPRTVAIEGSGSALPSKDFGASLMNPALLSGDGFAAGASWQSGDLADMQGIVALSHNFFIGRMQHTYGVVDNGKVPNYSETGESMGFSSHPVAQYYSITAAFPLELFRFGITGRYLWERLSNVEHSQVGMGLALDWGLVLNLNSTRYGFAFMGRHLGSQIRPFMRGGVNGYALASELAASTFWRSSQSFVWLFECSAPRYAPAVGRLGMEYRFSEPVFLRAGVQKELIDVTRYVRSVFDKNEDAPKTGFYRLFSLGAGYRGTSFALDYGFSFLFEGMGYEQRIGLSGNF